MNLSDLLTSLEGRISRAPFWIAFLCLALPEVAAHYAFGQRWSSIASLLLAYPQFAVFAKRGHDRNAPTWIPGLFFAGAVFFDLLAFLGMVGTDENPNTLFYVLGVPLGLFALVLLIDFGFRRGTVGPNRYGPDPLGGK
jgi:uncharacterized membrane protein YhaH (DUF805 family)